MALLIIVYRNNKSKQKTNELLNNQNEEIKALSDNLDELVKQRTKELQAALEKLSRRNQLWLKFSNMLAAKLGQPISGIDELVTNLEGKEVAKTLSKIEINNLLLYLNQLNSIKSDLSEVSSLTGIVIEQLETISIPPVFTSILTHLKDAIGKSDAKVTIEYNGINSVKGIRSFVENILLRLIAISLSNSAKPSNLVITVKLLKLKGMACISISDNITIDNQSFAKELTLDLVNLNDNSINGLSLILVQSQLVAMDGELEMDILPEMGMVMRIFLPLPEEATQLIAKQHH
jgi:light-regulated signal transduction histidine kinase (bacteriophytochrome)